jgi:cytochrome c oxidase subunit 2
MPLILFSLLALLGAAPAHAAEPEPWQMGFQPAATPVMARIESFNTFLSWIISLIAIFVLVLLTYVCYRFAATRHPTPSRRTHNTLLEIAWTTVPVLILVVIAIPSFKLLYYQDVVPSSDLTVKAIGHQWYWSYEYPDNGDFTFDANVVADADLKPGQPRLLTTDNAIVVPVDTNVRLLTTATDVIHSWAVPSFGVKIDAIPGRLNESWFRVQAPGIYYGQCSELCGDLHGFMPIMVKALPKDEFKTWVEQAKKQFAQSGAIDLARR